MNAPTLVVTSRDGRFAALAACMLALASAIAVLGIRVNHEQACTRGESIARAFCPSSAEVDRPALLRARIARNPGDTNAYAQLALSGTSREQERLAEIAARLAPRDPNLMLARASFAFQRQDWAAAVPLLIELANYRAVPEAVAGLAHIVEAGGAPLLAPHLAPGTQWLPRMLEQMRASGGTYSRALPLVIRAMQLGVIESDTVRRYIRELKNDKAWVDAYGLWLSLHGGSVPLLFNGSFDHAFEPEGFDWEVPAAGSGRRLGAIVDRRRAEQRGAVLDVQFTGRAIALPIVRQHLFISPGKYRLQGAHSAKQFRSEAGLAWVVRCGAATAARTGAFQDTQGLWRPFELQFAIPEDCGVVATLQLEMANPAEAALGARGRVAFDALSLERIAP